MSPKDADGVANSVDPDQTAPSGSTLFAAQACLFENLGSLQYTPSQAGCCKLASLNLRLQSVPWAI